MIHARSHTGNPDPFFLPNLNCGALNIENRRRRPGHWGHCNPKGASSAAKRLGLLAVVRAFGLFHAAMVAENRLVGAGEANKFRWRIHGFFV
ncbi:hypothetical protein [Bradyrhizobium sp.]|uniref:hypothetical protein n=1 Tax=Bradyrhizobium sp. TaxID=376 RepID=UPI0012E818ED|nr:hypothetical protein [Bradyrhizobium sp.]